jgi:hypothetical protein
MILFFAAVAFCPWFHHRSARLRRAKPLVDASYVFTLDLRARTTKTIRLPFRQWAIQPIRAERWSETLAPFQREPGKPAATFRHLFRRHTFRPSRAKRWPISRRGTLWPPLTVAPQRPLSLACVGRGHHASPMFRPAAFSPRCETLGRSSSMFVCVFGEVLFS